MKKLLLIWISILCYSAMYGQDFEVAPVKLSFKTDPGGTETQKVTIRNHGNKKEAFEFKISDYVVDEKGNKKKLPAGSTKKSCADWITINPSLLELNPNETRDIDVIMTVPAGESSTRWGMIAVQPTKEQSSFNSDKNMATGVLISPRIVIQVIQSPKSNTNYMATIQNLKEITQAKDTMRLFTVEVLNTGDKVIQPDVYLTIADISNGKEQKFPAETCTLFPDGKRIITLKLPKTIAKGKYALAALLDYGHGSAIEGVQMMIEQK